MKKTAKRLISLLLVSVMMTFCISASVMTVLAEPETTAPESSAADDSEIPDIEEEELQEMLEDGKMDMDVIFVLDASGSMLYSDPNKVAIDAFNLFVDLLDDTCGVGYVVYTQSIKSSSDIVSLTDSKSVNKVKQDINSLNYDPSGDTDIALGITKAMNIFKEQKNAEPGRKRTIFLLSDGNTDLPHGPRTVEESKKELASTLDELKTMDIPVYSVGLNYNGALDKDEIANISGKTGGKAYQTRQSTGLVKIAGDIFGDIYDLEGTQKEIVNGDVKIEVKDNTVFYVNVIIRSNFTREQLNPILTDPKGNIKDLDKDKNISVTSTRTYTLIKLIYPDSGTWNLHLSNVTQDNCTVTQMDFYSIYVAQEFSTKKAAPDSLITITASLNDVHGRLDDYDLINTITMKTIITGESGEQEIMLSKLSNGTFTGKIKLKAEGTYTVKTRAKGSKFQKSSRSAQIIINEKYAGMESSAPSKPQDSGLIDTSEGADANIGSKGLEPWVWILIIVAAIAIVVVILIIISRSKKQKPAPEEPEEEPRKPQALPTEKVKPMPKAKDPDLYDYEKIEHDKLENLVRKGPEDAFNANADNYKVDEDLAKLIKRGEEDPFNTKAENYQSDASLEQIVRRGEEDPFNRQADSYKADASLENIINSGEEDPFNTSAEDYQSDASLEKLVRRGQEDPFGASTDSYQADPSLAGIVRAGEEGLTGPAPTEETNDDDYNA